MGSPVRRVTDPSIIGKSHPPLSEPGRGPPSQPRSLAHRADPHEQRPRTRAYVDRRTADGKSKAEIMRILKRYIAREIFALLPRN